VKPLVGICILLSAILGCVYLEHRYFATLPPPEEGVIYFRRHFTRGCPELECSQGKIGRYSWPYKKSPPHVFIIKSGKVIPVHRKTIKEQ
jgi:hypothetical protein